MQIVHVDKYKKTDIIIDILLILITISVSFLGTFLGLFVVTLALPFAKEEGDRLPSGWRMKKLPMWAWLWSNDHDGAYGDKYGNYQSKAGWGFWAQWNWLAWRNSFNNGDRYVLGFNFDEIFRLEWTGSSSDAQSGGIGWTYFRAYTRNGHIYPGLIWNSLNRQWTIFAGWKIHRTKSDTAKDIGPVLRPQKNY